MCVIHCFNITDPRIRSINQKVHCDHGYPSWMFIILFSALAVWFSSETTAWYSWIKTECQIQRDGHAETVLINLFRGAWTWPGILVINGLYVLVEMTTVSLYWCKVRSLRKYQISNQKDRAVHDRIQSILHRVLILTFFYVAIGALMHLLALIGSIAVEQGWISSTPFGDWTLGAIMLLSITYSMFLMQDHNTSEYIAFLQFIKRSKCIWCFCCFQFMVNEQYRMLVDNVDKRKMKKIISAPTLQDYVSPTYENNTTGMEFSIESKTEVIV